MPTTEKVTEVPALADWVTGGTVMTTGSLTERVASALSTEPATLVATTS